MFVVFNNGEISSRGPIETLYNVKKINNVHATQNEPYGNEAEKFTIPHQSTISKEASDAYKRNANLNTQETIYHVNQIMNRNLFFVHDNLTVEETYSLLQDKNIRQLPIVDGIGKIKGMITQKDILDLIFNDLERVQQSVQKSLSDINLQELIAADPISDVRRVAKVMVDFNLNAMPIVGENDILVGIVSRSDILKAVASIPAIQLWA